MKIRRKMYKYFVSFISGTVFGNAVFLLDQKIMEYKDIEEIQYKIKAKGYKDVIVLNYIFMNEVQE